MSEPTYPCSDCGVYRTVAQGGRIFTVCDECWDKAYGAKSADPRDARIAAVTAILDDACIPVPHKMEHGEIDQLAYRVSLLRGRALSFEIDREKQAARIDELELALATAQQLAQERYEEVEEVRSSYGEPTNTGRPIIAALRVALAEACDIAARVISDAQVLPSTDHDRISALRLLSKPGKQ